MLLPCNGVLGLQPSPVAGLKQSLNARFERACLSPITERKQMSVFWDADFSFPGQHCSHSWFMAA